MNIKGVFQIGCGRRVPRDAPEGRSRLDPRGLQDCPDFAAEHADISTGGIGAFSRLDPDGGPHRARSGDHRRDGRRRAIETRPGEDDRAPSHSYASFDRLPSPLAGDGHRRPGPECRRPRPSGGPPTGGPPADLLGWHPAMGSLIKKRRKRMRKKKHKKMLKAHTLAAAGAASSSSAGLGLPVSAQAARRVAARYDAGRGLRSGVPDDRSAARSDARTRRTRSPRSRPATVRCPVASPRRPATPPAAARPRAPPAPGRCAVRAGPPELVAGLVDRRRRHAEAAGRALKACSDLRRRAAAPHLADPVTRARPPPSRQNGTSAPEPAASAWPIGRRPAQRSTAAASAEPPPRPAPAGMRFRAGPRPAARRARAPGRRGCRPSDGHRSRAAGRPATSSTTSSAVAAPKIELVGEVDRDHLRVEEVVPVVAAPDDPEGPRQLGRRRHVDRAPVTDLRPPAMAAPACPTPRRRAPRPGRRVHPGRREGRRRSTRPASDRRSILRRWRSRRGPAVNIRRAPTTAGSTAGACAAADARQGPTRPRAGARRPSADTVPTTAASRAVGHLDRDRAVGRAARRRHEPLADLALHHHEHARRSPALLEQIGDQRRGDVVGQVGDQHPAGPPARAARPSRACMASPSTTAHRAPEPGDQRLGGPARAGGRSRPRSPRPRSRRARA